MSVFFNNIFDSISGQVFEDFVSFATFRTCLDFSQNFIDFFFG